MSEYDDWNNAIIEEFRANEGRVGGQFEGAPMILIHHVGVKSGIERVTPLVNFPEGDGSRIIVGSNAGGPRHPAWFHNIRANPRIEVEVGTERYPVVATEVTGPERDALFEKISSENPGFAEYQRNTDRVIPLVRLTRAA